tara:strand:- start:12 stop:167 length:156 start_codon:yes stop_codon:yes gene_type:complete
VKKIQYNNDLRQKTTPNRLKINLFGVGDALFTIIFLNADQDWDESSIYHQK